MGGAAAAAELPPIKIGEISSYSALPIGTRGYRQGWELARDEVNAKGGVLGRKLEIIARDDAGKPDVAITQAAQLVDAEQVELLTGTILSHIGLAVADFAKQRQMFFLASQPLTDALIWEKGNRYTFRLRASTYTQASILAQEAAKFPAKRWATIAPNYELGQAAVASFKREMKRLRPDVEFVNEQWPPLGKVDAGPVLQAMMADKPEAVFNVMFGPDLAKLVREGTTRKAFEGRTVVSLLTGEPEYLAPLKDEAPPGWLVTGYPPSEIKTPEHEAFRKAYADRFKEQPNIGALMGYINTMVLAKAIEAAGSTKTDDLIEAMEHLKLDTPVGRVAFRAIDHQSTMGVYVGKLAVRDGQGVMTDWRYVDGADYQPADTDVLAKLKN
ncbi:MULTISPECIES: ABC transporter substrate-binding protein [unclassified Bradyrhizobium]|uniref:ABC transporter substrate-binding protein n=1 Tax=unclassified Bradyrhizobium TaxID=2631580 RepID=UPI002447022A|nr:MULTISPECIES: ABC transporter substrate-binding protein [unclassified Bradyrhizobium]MDH2347936.1 ABC transporter substrate-binding protein [Bradyrhizobium sp. SSUT77]MDH2355757.1 ABC transporter substrate-binding protein [Bradyrhizobium sp. SSUT112]